MRMHNVAIVCGRLIYFENYSVIQKFHHVLLCFCSDECKEAGRSVAEG